MVLVQEVIRIRASLVDQMVNNLPTDQGSIPGSGRSPGEGNGKPLQYSCLENPMNTGERQKDRTLKDELPRSVCTQYATGEEWRNNSRKKEEMEPKRKQCPVVDVINDESKV